MIIGTAQITLYLSETRSLKEKRSIIRPLIERTRHKFHLSVAEVGDQDDLRLSTIGFAVVSSNSAHASAMVQTILTYVEQECTEAELGEVETELITL